MKNVLLVVVFLVSSAESFALTIDAVKFRAVGFPDDICLAIQSAIASIPTDAASSVVVDARGFSPSATSSLNSANHLVCSVNPFAVGGVAQNPIVLVFGGISPTSMHIGSSGSAG